MNSFNFIGDGKTKTFYFTFPFFTKQDVVVEINGQPASGFEIYPTSSTLNADIPYSGGKIVFKKPPKSLDVITISRKLELKRIVDYQPTARLTPMMINQDMNFMMEILKDMKSDLIGFANNYAEIADKDSTKLLLDRISAVTSEIENFASEISTVRQDISDLGDVNAIHNSINSLNNSVASLTNSITAANSNILTLHDFKDGVLDYVVESQLPNASNNYTWYRKYKSGWVEQGGRQTGHEEVQLGYDADLGTITLPIPMQNANYYTSGVCTNFFSQANVSQTTTTLKLHFVPYETPRILTMVFWRVCGQSA